MSKITSDIPTSYSTYNGACLASYRPRPYGDNEIRLSIPNGGDSMFQERPSSHFKLALFTCLCCFCPAGITALVYACRSRAAKARGDWSLAAQQGKNAKDLAIVAISLGIFFVILGGVLAAVFYLTYIHVHEHDHDHDHNNVGSTTTPQLKNA